MEARFIGRESAMRAMLDLSKNLGQGLGGLIWIEGEPGIGKSRLMREFTASMATASPLVWRGRCSPHRTNHAFSLFADLLAHALSLQPSDSPEQIRARIDQYMQQWPRDAQATRPHLEALLGVQPSGFSGERLRSLQPEELQRQIFVALRKLFKSLAAEQPLVVLMDDLHWIDPVSAELLLFLLTMVTSVPILFVCAQRRQGADSPNDRLVRTQSLISSQTIRLRLDRLSLVESEMLLDEILGQPELPARLTSAITQRSEGNPYFIEEYVRMLIEQGHLHRQRGRWELDPELDLAGLSLPSSLENLIRSRIDALPQELKRLIQYAAVVGSPFEVHLLESIPGLSQVPAGLSRLESRLLAHAAAEAGRWQFNHSLIETIAYNSLLKARRQQLHLHVAEALEARWSGAEADHAEELAHHFSFGGKGAKALHYLILAGERAAARYANEEALSFLERAAWMLDDLPDTPAALRCRIAARLGDVHREMGQYAESKAALDMGWALAEAAGLADELQAGLVRRLGDTAQKQGDFETASAHFAHALSLLGVPDGRETLTEASHLMTSLAWTHFLQGRFDQARQACQASLEYAERAGALNELARAENLLGGIHFNQGQWEPALQHTTRAMVLREQLGYSWGVASTLGNLGILALMTGQWSKAWSFMERSLALREEIGDVEGIAIAHANLGMLARDQGRLELAEHHLQASLEVSQPFKMNLYVIHATMAMAQVQVWQGQMEATHQSIAASLQDAETLGATDVLAEIRQIQAEFLLATNDPDEARVMADQAASLAVEIGNRGFEAAAWRLAAEAELLRGDPQAAREALANAQQILHYVTHELQTGRVAALSGRISLAEGRFAQAEQDLRAAREIFTRLGASRDLQLVQDTMRRLPRPEADEVLSSLAR
jgi:predicted ATPase